MIWAGPIEITPWEAVTLLALLVSFVLTPIAAVLLLVAGSIHRRH